MRGLAIAFAHSVFLLPPSGAGAQEPPRRSGVSLYVSYGPSNLTGAASAGGLSGPGALGIAFERPIAERYSWRAEAFLFEAAAKLGERGDQDYSGPTTLTLSSASIGGTLRRYGAHGTYVGLGASFAAPQVCTTEVDGYVGGFEQECGELGELEINPASPVAAAVVSAGVQRGRFGLALRYDHGLQPSIETLEGGLSVRSVGAMLEYRFGKGGASRRPVDPQRLRHAGTVRDPRPTPRSSSSRMP